MRCRAVNENGRCNNAVYFDAMYPPSSDWTGLQTYETYRDRTVFLEDGVKPYVDLDDRTPEWSYTTVRAVFYSKASGIPQYNQDSRVGVWIGDVVAYSIKNNEDSYSSHVDMDGDRSEEEVLNLDNLMYENDTLILTAFDNKVVTNPFNSGDYSCSITNFNSCFNCDEDYDQETTEHFDKDGSFADELRVGIFGDKKFSAKSFCVQHISFQPDCYQYQSPMYLFLAKFKVGQDNYFYNTIRNSYSRLQYLQRFFYDGIDSKEDIYSYPEVDKGHRVFIFDANLFSEGQTKISFSTTEDTGNNIDINFHLKEGLNQDRIDDITTDLSNLLNIPLASGSISNVPSRYFLKTECDAGEETSVIVEEINYTNEIDFWLGDGPYLKYPLIFKEAMIVGDYEYVPIIYPSIEQDEPPWIITSVPILECSIFIEEAQGSSYTANQLFNSMNNTDFWMFRSDVKRTFDTDGSSAIVNQNRHLYEVTEVFDGYVLERPETFNGDFSWSVVSNIYKNMNDNYTLRLIFTSNVSVYAFAKMYFGEYVSIDDPLGGLVHYGHTGIQFTIEKDFDFTGSVNIDFTEIVDRFNATVGAERPEILLPVNPNINEAVLDLNTPTFQEFSVRIRVREASGQS